MKNNMLLIALALLFILPAFAEDKEKKEMKEDQRLGESAVVLKEILGMPEGIPKDLLDKSVCVVVYPSVKKAAFIVGGSYGRGVVTCRSGKEFGGRWSAPAMFALEGGSFGFQIGAQATDFVLLIMNESGANSIMSSKVKLGADASAAAGPVGRNASAETDVVMKAEILSYSRAKGLFAGISLEGSTLRSDDGGNKAVYRKELTAKEIVREGKVATPAAAKRLLAILQKASPKHTVAKSR
ncbi:MAG TPA: lipid-binding SYLF domain-containing protein [Terriglobales bacterium]|nr:lipid-binding SYLF domain-containing protein [Terriglobales bacterium]